MCSVNCTADNFEINSNKMLADTKYGILKSYRKYKYVNLILY